MKVGHVAIDRAESEGSGFRRQAMDRCCTEDAPEHIVPSVGAKRAAAGEDEGLRDLGVRGLKAPRL